MRAFRPRLIAIALALLLQQAAGVAAVAALACCEAEARAATPMPCCAKGDAGHICPIGKRTDAAPRCRLTNECDRTREGALGAAMFLLSSPAAASVVAIAPDGATVRDRIWEASPLERTASPPTRPPRS